MLRLGAAAPFYYQRRPGRLELGISRSTGVPGVVEEPNFQGDAAEHMGDDTESGHVGGERRAVVAQATGARNRCWFALGRIACKPYTLPAAPSASNPRRRAYARQCPLHAQSADVSGCAVPPRCHASALGRALCGCGAARSTTSPHRAGSAGCRRCADASPRVCVHFRHSLTSAACFNCRRTLCGCGAARSSVYSLYSGHVGKGALAVGGAG
jgi:hypothetical protein